MAGEKLYLLIKWLEDVDAETYSVVRSNRATDFDFEMFQSGSPDKKKIYTVQRRRDGKFPICKAEVLDVNENKSVLKEKRFLLEEKYKNKCENVSVSLKRAASSGKHDATRKSKQVKLFGGNDKPSPFEEIKSIIQEFVKPIEQLLNKMIEMQTQFHEFQMDYLNQTHENHVEFVTHKYEYEVQKIWINDTFQVNSQELLELKQQVSRLAKVVAALKK